jgi:NitT/TauT family transport system substrate-binding protein
MRKLVAILVAVGVLSSGRNLVSAADKIRIAVSNFNISFLQAGVATKKGFFRDEGLDVEVIRMSPPVSVAALISGDLDYNAIFGSSVRAAVRGLPIKVLASFVNGSTHALIAQPGITSAKDLRGKTLGVGTVGDTSDISARMMIRHFGVDPEKEMKILAVGRDFARLTALKEKLIDVAVTSPPADTQGKKMGFNVLARAYEVFRVPFIGLSATDRKIRERPEEAKRTLKALIRANRYMRDDRAGAIQTLIEWGKVDRENATAAYDSSVAVLNLDGSIPEEGLRIVIDQAKKEGKITREIAFADIADLSILREVQKELGIRQR